MPTVFSRIIARQIPGHFVWEDALCAAFLSINPIRPGHTLIVPKAEVDHWIDLDTETASHLMETSRIIGQALQKAFHPKRIGMMIAGFEIPHTHIHLVPLNYERELSFKLAEANPDPKALVDAVEKIRNALREMNYGDKIPTTE